MNSLVESLVHQKVITSQSVKRVFLSLDRKLFCPSKTERVVAYNDAPTDIGCGQTISAPHMHAICLEACRQHLETLCTGNKESTRTIRILDVGSGSGFLTAAFALLLKEMGLLESSSKGFVQVIGIEKYDALTSASMEHVRRAIPQNVQSHISLITANAYEYDGEGMAFDFIHCGAAAEHIPPNLVKCLKPGGEMILPLGPHDYIQHMTIVQKAMSGGGRLEERTLMPVRYVPLD